MHPDLIEIVAPVPVVHLVEPEPQPSADEQAEAEFAANLFTLYDLTQRFAHHHGVPFRVAFDALNGLSPNVAHLLSSAQGHAMLAIGAACLLGIDPVANPFTVRTH